MADPEGKRGGDITSPCTQICQFDPRRGLCRGCYRSLEEIESWMRYTPARKRAVLALLPVRRAAA